MTRKITTSLIATVGAALAVAPAAAQVTTYELAGEITSASNLTFAVFNGTLLSSNPQAGDLPLSFTGTLVVDETNETAVFEFGGSFTSPTRAYTFDVVSDNVFAGVVNADQNGANVTFAGDDLVLSVAFNVAAEGGSFTYTAFDAVPIIPADNVTASGLITSVNVITNTSPADLAEPFGVLDIDDIDAFIDAFIAGDALADLAAPLGVVDISDVDAFIDAFLAGTP